MRNGGAFQIGSSLDVLCLCPTTPHGAAGPLMRLDFDTCDGSWTNSFWGYLVFDQQSRLPNERFGPGARIVHSDMSGISIDHRKQELLSISPQQPRAIAAILKLALVRMANIEWSSNRRQWRSPAVQSRRREDRRAAVFWGRLHKCQSLLCRLGTTPVVGARYSAGYTYYYLLLVGTSMGPTKHDGSRQEICCERGNVHGIGTQKEHTDDIRGMIQVPGHHCARQIRQAH